MNAVQYICRILLLSAMLWLLCPQMLHSQEQSNLRHKTIAWPQSPVQLDTLIIAPTSLTLVVTDTLLRQMYGLSDTGQLIMKGPAIADSVRVSYRVLPLPYQDSFASKDTLLMRDIFEYTDPFAYKPGVNQNRRGLIDLAGFEKRGSISRGVQVGNAQDLSVSSELNLQLSGQITERISLLANISDDNIPIQADGSTQQLQEFDQVFVKLYGGRTSLIAGDYQVHSREGYFSKYLKKARGALFETQIQSAGADSSKQLSIRGGAAISRGKFSRNIIPGVEGNQGPYKLRGAEGELFVIVLSGTERVFIDGYLLKRGKEFDYTIDYNAAEITFTANQLITKDKRIAVEFQYTQQSYARSLIQTEVEYDSGPWKSFINVYAEQDAKRQSLQQDLDNDDRLFLSQIGDELNQAIVTEFDTVPFTEGAVLYALRDSLGFDSIYVYTTQAIESVYQLTFTRVGTGLGDYVEDDFSANGRVFRWVTPVFIDGQLVSQGDHVVGALLITPKSQRLLNAGIQYTWKEQSWLSMEGAFSEENLNTFSSIDSEDDVGLAFQFIGNHSMKFDSALFLTASSLVEYTGQNFSFIERYRAVEFERNWNLQLSDLEGDQLQVRTGLALNRGLKKRLGYSYDRLDISNGYQGGAHELSGQWEDGPYRLRADASLLQTEGVRTTRFERHASDVSRSIGSIRIGFKDLRERNEFSTSSDSLAASSYGWYQWETYVASQDTANWNYRLFFRDREDISPVADRLVRSAKAREYGVEFANPAQSNHHIRVVTAWRALRIIRSEAINATPEETFLGRVDYRANWLDGVIRTNSFYEVGSGLERRKQFVYIEVPAGQGAYVWIDYNGDGVRDLEEFELAQFQYEANFIRVFTPTDNFEKTFTNQVSQSVSIDPRRKWRTEDGWKGFVARFSDQASWRAERKTSDEEGLDAYDPFIQDLDDDALLSLSNSLRNSVFFNKSSPIWSLDHTYTDVKNKQLLTNGFESRSERENKVEVRYTIARKYTLRLAIAQADRGREASYSSTRNYTISEQRLLPSVEWQPDRNLRLSLLGESTLRNNRTGDGTRADILKAGFESRYSDIDKGSLNLRIDIIRIAYNGPADGALAFEMLDGLRPGNNLTWNLYLQRTLAKNLELNVNYDGRKSEGNAAIHAGGVQVRAFF